MIKAIKNTYLKLKSIKIANQLMEKDNSFSQSLAYDFTQYLNKNHHFFDNFLELSPNVLIYISDFINVDLVDKKESSILLAYAKKEIDSEIFEQVLMRSHNSLNIHKVALNILGTFFNEMHNSLTSEYEQQKEKFLITLNHPDLNLNTISYGWKGNFTLLDELITYCFNYATLPSHEKLFIDLANTQLKEVLSLENLTQSYETWVRLFNNGNKTQASETLYKNLLPIVEKDRLEQILNQTVTSHKKLKI